MLTHTILFRLSAIAAIVGLVAGPALPPPLFAQGVPAAGPEVTPPQRVGRLAWTEGTVSFHTADQDNWSPALVNYPLTSGDGIWTQPGAEAGLQVADASIDMNATTEFDVNTLDNSSFVAAEPQGEVYVHVRDLQPGENYTLQTPRGTVIIAAPGRYEIAAGTTQTPTLVTVVDGAAQISGAVSVNVAPGQTVVITGDQTFQGQIQPMMHDAFLDAMLAREQRSPPQVVTLPVVVQQMPGAADLSDYGSWSTVATYGQVWYPRVPAGWVPYRDGFWSYVAPWGWTWVDAEPWGFAPFHYGRWIFIGGRWAWTPAVAAAAGPPVPCYAPALVTFFGVGVGMGATLAAEALLHGSVGWVPLGWNEPYHPWFHASSAWVRNVNIHNVTNINNINTRITNISFNNFRNAHAATVIPASAMVTSRPVRALARDVQATQFGQFHPLIGRDPVPPITATHGVTPGLAQRLHIAAPPHGIMATPPPRAPGPVIRVQGQIPGAGHLATPALRGRREVRPVTAGVAHPPAAGGTALTPHPGAPALRAPGAGAAHPPMISNERPGHAVAGPAGLHRQAPPQAHPAPPVRPRAGIARRPAPVMTHAPIAAPRSGEPHFARPGPHPPAVHEAQHLAPPVHVAAPAPHPAPAFHAARHGPAAPPVRAAPRHGEPRPGRP